MRAFELYRISVRYSDLCIHIISRFMFVVYKIFVFVFKESNADVQVI
jgi:hypothetical protein